MRFPKVLLLFCTFLSFYFSQSVTYSQDATLSAANGGFEENKGQIYDDLGKFRRDVYYVSEYSGAKVYFTNEGVVFYFNKIEASEYDKIRAGKIPNPYTDKEWESIMYKISQGTYDGDIVKTNGEYYRIDINFPGATLNKPEGEKEKLEKRHYYNANHPDGLRDVPLFEKIRYKEIYPGIDLVFYSKSGKLKYDFEISANADPRQIKILYKGEDSVKIDASGNAVVHILPGEIIENTPESYQNGKQVDSKFIVSNDTIKFELGHYDKSEPLTIDPTLAWSTYFYDNSATTAAFTYTNPSWDSNGNMYVVLNTYATTFPTVNPGGSTYYQSAAGSTGLQLVIMKFNTSRQVVWSTYYAGSASSQTKFTNQSVAIDQSNNLYVIGSVFYVYGCPCTLPLQDMGGGAYYETEQGNNRNFILKFSSAGVRLWATMFNKTAGASSSGLELSGITIDKNNKLLVTGCTYTPSGGWNPMPLVNPGGSYYYKGAPVESQVPTLHRFTTAGVLEWSTYISQGAAGKYCGSYSCLAVDGSNNIFLSSDASSSYTTVNPGGAYVDGVEAAKGRKLSIFKFASTGALNWCTLYGGIASANSILWQDTRDIKVASNGDVILAGRSNTTDFPTYDPGGGAYMKTTLSTGSTSVYDGVILQFSNGGVRKWATYYGGNGTSDGTDFWGLGIDASNNITVSGVSRSPSFPTLFKAGSYNQSSITGSYAIVFAQFNISGVRQWASYFGDQTWISTGGFGLTNGACGAKIVQCGYNDNAYSITTVDPGSGAYYHSTKEAGTGQTDIIIEFSEGLPANVSISASANTVCAGTNITFTATPTNGGASPSYQWYLNGSAVGTNSPTYSNSGLTNGSTVYCIMTSNLGGCVLNNPATSNTVTMIINTANLTFTTPSNISVSNDPNLCSAVVSYTTPTASTSSVTTTAYTNTYNYSGSIVTWTVPTGVTSINVTAKGAQGGSNGGTGGTGAIMSGTFGVSAGQVLSILVGQQPTGAGSYAAGGGGTYVALGGTYATATPLIVAGGGGGSVSGTGGDASTSTSGNGPAPGTLGNGAPTTSCGGGGGGFYSSGGNDNLTSPTFISYGAAGFRQGGAGGLATGYQSGGFGGGAAANYYGSCNMRAGAGGGYSGGSGLNSGAGQAVGYGGGSYNGGTGQSNSVGNTGNGQVVINYNQTTGSVVAATVTQTSGLPSGSTFPAGTTTNVFSATDGNGCTGTTSFTVTVNAASSVAPTSISGTTIICNGTSTALTAVGGADGVGANLNWYTGDCGDIYTQEWFTQPFGSGSTNINSVNGVLNVTSTTNDPMIFMSGLGSFAPSTYKYIQIRYRVTAGAAGTAEIFFYNANHNYAVGGESASGALVSDGAWHILNIDMTADPDYTTGGNITGWRFDWSSASGVTMDIDYISLGAGLAIGQGSPISVNPNVSTTYYVLRSGACNTTACASQLVTVSSPSGTSPTSLSAGDYVWSGNTSLYWGATSNWLTYNGSTFSSAGAIPTSSNNVFIRAYAGCASNAAHIASGSSANCNNLTIETTLTMDNTSSELNVYGNWTNNGTFVENKNTVIFNGPSNVAIAGSNATSFYNLTINKSSSANVTNNIFPLTVGNDLIVNSGGQMTLSYSGSVWSLINNNFTVNSGGTFNHNVGWNGYALNIGGNMAIDGTYSRAGYAPLINMIGSGTKYIRGTNLGYLTLKNGDFYANGTVGCDNNFWAMWGTGGSFHTNGNSVTASAGLYNDGGTVYVDGGSLNITGGGINVGYAGIDGAMNISSGTANCDRMNVGDGTRLGAVTHSGGTANINGNIIIYSSCTYTCSNSPAINVTGDWTNNGSFTAATSTVAFNGSIAETVGGISTSTFNNLTINNSSGASNGVYLGLNVPVNNLLTLTTGALKLNSYMLTVNNALPAAIVRTAGYVVSEMNNANNTSKLQWNIGSNISEHIFPFGTFAGEYIPVKFQGSGTGPGNISISTRPTGTDNTPLAAACNVAVCSQINGGGGSNNGVTSVIDRWWDITSSLNPTGTTPIPAVTLTLTYRGSENTMTAPTSILGFQHWTGSIWNDGHGGSAGTVTSTGTAGLQTGQNSVTASGLTQFSPYVIVRSNAPLPVELLNFTANCNDDKVIIKWTTATEINNDYFTIERSQDGLTWETLFTVLGAGNSNSPLEYKHFDNSPISGTAYYRLKQTDYDGSYKYFEPVEVNCNDEESGDPVISLYPNPFSSDIVLDIQNFSEDSANIILYDILGNKVMEKNISKSNIPDHKLTLELDALSFGVYTLTFVSGDFSTTSRIVKINSK